MLPPAQSLRFSGVQESGAPLGLWETSPSILSTTIEARYTPLQLPLKPAPPLSALEATIRSTDDRVLRERLQRRRRIHEGLGEGQSAAMGLWLWRIGDSVLLGQPNEAYSCLAIELRRRFPKIPIGVMNVVNGYYGYLPPQELYGRNLYPVWQTPFAAGSLEILIAEAERMIVKLFHQT